MTTVKDLKDLFCSWCDASEKYLQENNRSDFNYVGNLIGWVIKYAADDKRRSFYNYQKVYRRDQYQCQYCGYTLKNCLEFRPLHIDHVLPHSCAGGNKMDNLVVACAPCNLCASDKWFYSFREKFEYIKGKRGF
jgi:CRISPR/Cas system Type II protein with McrA/HNH and RuvC-like nuclease domain